MSSPTMQYFGGKLSAAQLHVAGWVGGVRRSFQGALALVWSTAEEDKDNEENKGGNGNGRLQKAVLPLRSFAHHSRRSMRHFSIRSRQTVQKRSTETCTDPDSSYRTRRHGEEMDALIDLESERQHAAYEWRSKTDRTAFQPSPRSLTDPFAEVSDDLDATELAPSPFPESSTPLLNTKAQRSRADLGKQRIRSRPSRSSRSQPSTIETPDWRSCDSTDGGQRESDSEEEQPKLRLAPSPSASRKVPVFPGVSPLTLIAQMKKRAEGREETEDNKESPNDEVVPPPSPLPRLPRSAAQLAGAARVLPPIGATDGGAVSPAWLTELKSKKRISQHEGEW